MNTWEISYIITGRGIRIIGDTKESFKEGEIVLVLPDMPHQWIFSPKITDKNENIENITISFSPELLPHLAALIPEYREMEEWYDRLETSIKFSKSDCEMINTLLRRMEFESPAIRVNSLLQLLTEIYNNHHFTVAGHFAEPVTKKGKMKKVKIYISCNYQHRIRIEDIATHVAMNKSMLCSAFKENTGKTIMEYLTDLRIQLVKHLLKKKDCTISSCCYECGFNDVPHFNRTLKKIVGISPSEYRKNNN